MLYALGFALLLANGVTAQQLRGIVSGTVRDGKQPLGFVNVAVKGTKIGTYSDEDGNYSLQVPEGMQELMFTTVGYQLKKQSVKVGS